MSELVCVSFCSLLFIGHFFLHKVTNDDTKQYLVLIMFLFYAATVLFDFCFRDEFIRQHSTLLLFRHFCVIASFFTSVVYVRSLFDDKIFSVMTRVILCSLVAIYVCFVIFSVSGYSAKILVNAVITVAAMSLLLYVIFLIIRWKSLSVWNESLLLSMFITVVCFTAMELLHIVGFKYKFVMTTGLIVYMIVYEILSFFKILSIMSEHNKAVQAKNADPTNLFGFTPTECDILDIMRTGVTSSKEIALIINKRPDTVHKHIKNIMFKTKCSDRKKLISVIDAASVAVGSEVSNIS